jgi:hypothetical protein
MFREAEMRRSWALGPLPSRLKAEMILAERKRRRLVRVRDVQGAQRSVRTGA